MLQILVEALKLIPCSPDFIMARDSIIEAAKGHPGVDVCVIWKGFAKRGLGVNAKSGGVEDFKLPGKC